MRKRNRTRSGSVSRALWRWCICILIGCAELEYAVEDLQRQNAEMREALTTMSESASVPAAIPSHHSQVPQAGVRRACSATRTRSTPCAPPRRSKSTSTCKGSVSALSSCAHELTAAPQYLDEFSKALASEVRMLLGEVGKLREEKRALQ
jgi:hypothetical protein